MNGSQLNSTFSSFLPLHYRPANQPTDPFSFLVILSFRAQHLSLLIPHSYSYIHRITENGPLSFWLWVDMPSNPPKPSQCLPTWDLRREGKRCEAYWEYIKTTWGLHNLFLLNLRTTLCPMLLSPFSIIKGCPPTPSSPLRTLGESPE